MKVVPENTGTKPQPNCPVNLFARYVAPNPSVSFNPGSVSPTIDATAFVGPFSSIIGDVRIGRNVFVAPLVSVRADEGFPFYIGENSNLQDGAILHGLAEGRVRVGGEEYSIYISERVSCTHGCIVHGPCLLGERVFVGFHAIVFNTLVGEGSYISMGALVTGGVKIAPERFVPPGAIVDTQAKADALGPVRRSQREFAEEVIHVNREFPAAYMAQCGGARCSCGMAYEPEGLLR